MPLKRHNALVQLSREHHYALLLCWKIKKGLIKNVDISRISIYSDWFYLNHLKPHFAIEEQTLFPILGSSHKIIKDAISQHHELKNIFENPHKTQSDLLLISQKLEEHVRFEERIVFEEIQKKASNEQFINISENNTHVEFVENDEDKFWE